MRSWTMCICCAVPVFTLLRDALEREVGNQLHQGKTKVWNKSGRPPEDVRTLGRDAWQPAGIRVLGTPIGTAQFVADAVCGRPYRRCRISSVRGRFWSRAPTHERTTHCALCLQANVLVMPRRTTWVYGTQLSPWHRCGARTRSSGRHPPNENGRFGLEISSKVLDGSVLGFVG